MPKCLLYSACRTYVFLFAVAAATAVNYQTVCCAYALVALTLFLGWQERQPVNILLQNAWNWISSWCKWSGYSLEYTLLIPPAYVKKKTTKSFQSVPWTHTQYKNDWGLRSRRQPINPGLLGKWPFKQCVCAWVLPYILQSICWRLQVDCPVGVSFLYALVLSYCPVGIGWCYFSVFTY